MDPSGMPAADSNHLIAGNGEPKTTPPKSNITALGNLAFVLNLLGEHGRSRFARTKANVCRNTNALDFDSIGGEFLMASCLLFLMENCQTQCSCFIACCAL